MYSNDNKVRTECVSGAGGNLQAKRGKAALGFRWLAAAALLLLSAFIRVEPASAHMNTFGYSSIQIDAGKLNYGLYLDAQEVAQWMDVHSGGVFILGGSGGERPAEGEAAWTAEELRPLVQQYLTVKEGGRPVPLGSIDGISVEDKSGIPYLYMDLAYELNDTADGYTIDYGFFFDMDINHQNFASIRSGESSQNIVFTNDRREFFGRAAAGEGAAAATVEVPGWLVTAWEYVVIGVEHIWGGIDHLLFILALVMARQQKWDYVKVITAFTAGHSLTIALAALDIVNLPAAFVEPVIALSIAYVAIENLIRKQINRRWIVAMLFGLIHGFGFAQVLQGVQGEHLLLSLFSFNLGVELGQLVVLAVLLPVLFCLRRHAGYRYVNLAASGAVTAVALFWTVTRVTEFIA
ncbi:HupE/UreJ family protein [Paenibacillus thailandensis]|uniref:HupE/UreJ family protein n=1 Tax=Paenibacillus thailandensis TaxID=393250 RepID=A0ABW5QZM5_9BACL